MRTSPNNRDLSELVQRAREGLIALPKFQRNFVWPRKGVLGLLDSLLRGHYVGALLFLETNREHMPFGHRPIAGLDAPNGAHPEDLVLDGQQRITALHYAFSAPDRNLRDTNKPHRFFLRLYRLEDLEDADDLVVSGRDNENWVKLLENPETQYEWKNLPFTEVLNWEDWKKGYAKWLFDKDPQAGIEHHVSGEQDRWDEAVRRVRDAEVPVVRLGKVSPGDNTRIRQICEVFEKLNSTGLKLTVFDLMTARLYRNNVDLHWLWNWSLQEYPRLREFAGGEPSIEEADSDDFGVLLLRTVALLRGQEVKSKRLIELDTEGFEDDWERASAAMERAIQRVESRYANGFGAFDRKWLPYKTILPVLAAVLDKIESQNAGAHAYALVKRWYWASVFLGRYTGATETVAYEDYGDITRILDSEEGAKEPAALVVAREEIVENPGFSLRRVASGGAAAYKGAMCLVALEGARDFANNDGITFHQLDDHHIFPRKFLKDERGLEGADANTIVNRTLIAGRTNRRISSKSPSNYLKTVVPDGHRDDILASHLVGAEAHAAMRKDDYDAFLEARERALISKIKELVS